MKLPLVFAAGSLAAVVGSLPAMVPPMVSGQSPSTDLTGTYRCEGTRPDGQRYNGTVVIVRHDHTYQLLWTLTGDDQYLGIGIRRADALSVSYFGSMGGVVSYHIVEPHPRDSGRRRPAANWRPA